MTYMTPVLKYKVHFKKGEYTPNDDGGLDISYTTLKTCWAGIKNVSKFVEAIRNESITDVWTIEIIVRKSSVERLGVGFSTGFSSGFDSIPDINPIKANMFCLIEAGAAYRGRLFKVVSTQLDEDKKEYLKVRLKEVEEHGTGGTE